MRLREPGQTHLRSTPELLVSAIERLAGARSKADVVDVLRATARRLAGADGIAIVLRDGGSCSYVEEDAIGPLWKGGRFPIETCISGWAMMNAKTAVILDIFADPRVPHALYRDRFVKSLVMTPIGRDEPIAALGAYWARPYAPPEEVVQTLETLARAAATALENAYLFEALSSSLRRTELAREDLRHRLRNALGAIEAYGRTALEEDSAKALLQRVSALGRAHALLDQRLTADVTLALSDLVDAELDPYRPEEASDRIAACGPDVRLSGAQAIAVGLVLNELAVNAARSGALKSLSGQVEVSWREEGRVVTIEWREIDARTARRGIEENVSAQMVRTLVASQLDGNVRGSVSEGVVTFTIEFPNETMIRIPPNASST